MSLLFSWLFWSVLWQGGGLIGGDLYPYYLPQKTWLQASLNQGEIPLWNPWVGFGYPVLGESQTGALYPPNLLLYRFCDVNTAYVASQLGHYLMAFCLTAALGLRLGLSRPAGWIMATTFVYGWFPPRICLEWAIIGGTWMAGSLWAATGLLQTGRRRWMALLAGCTALNLLAGHYNLEFITLLLLSAWPWIIHPQRDGTPPRLLHWRRLGIGVLLGFCLAAVQLAPTWELKQLSQRQADHPSFEPTYGHLPPSAISQLWNPWGWYAGAESMDRRLEQSGRFAVPNATNQAEAQLYAGLLPLLLAFAGWAVGGRPWATAPVGTGRRWGLVLAVSLLLATGWPTWLLADLPGFSFFRGPGRYSIAAVLAIGLMAGFGFDALTKRRNWSRRPTLIISLLVLGMNAADLWSASRQYRFGAAPYFGRQVFYATLVDHPPIDQLSGSPLRRFFERLDDRVRLYAPGPNMPSMLGVSALPVYLGLGPEIYETDEVRVDFGETDATAVDAATEKLRRLGITHLLLEQRLDADLWHVTSLGDWGDPLLNGAFARREPFHLYELRDAPGRVSFVHNRTDNQVLKVESGINSLTVRVQVKQRDQLIVRDLAFPGWTLSGDGIPGVTSDGLFRTVDLEPRAEPIELVWHYRPASYRWGAALSGLGVLLTLGLSLSPKRFAREPSRSTP